MLFVGADVLVCHGYDASSSDLTSVPTNIPSNATIVRLNNNRIINVTSGVFSHLSRCSDLLLNSNRLILIKSGAFAGLQGLIFLDLSENYISQTIEVNIWNGLQYLERLYLYGNYIDTISPRAFSSLIFLKTLHLSGNRLSEINGSMWVGLQFLETLYLVGLRLRDIPRHGISHMPSLTKLHLDNNLLTTLKADMFNPDIKEHHEHLALLLAGNMLQCNSDLCWLQLAIQSGSVSISGYCAGPGRVKISAAELNCTSGKYYSLHAYIFFKKFNYNDKKNLLFRNLSYNNIGVSWFSATVNNI